MAETTEIQWCDSTMNPVIGCTKVGPPCLNCYAAVSTPVRAMKIEWGAGKPRYRTSDATWKQPLTWERQHQKFFAAHGRRRRVFCASLADVFDNEWDPQWRADLWALIRATPNLLWMLLTKRIGNAERMLPADWGDGYANVMLGSTIADQSELRRDIRKLFEVPVLLKFISYEPALGPLDIDEVMQYWDVDLVIAGGESGRDARPADIQWFRSLRWQCLAHGTSFFMKQLGGVRHKRGRLEDLPEDLRVREFPL